MRSIAWGIIGLGQIAEEFAPAIIQAGGRLKAVGSREESKARSFAERHGAQSSFGSYEDLLADKEIDVVYISTPHMNHAELIEKCLCNGKHVLCEKAITINKAEYDKVAKLANASNLLLGEAMTIYHMPINLKIRNMIDEGIIGRIKFINIQFGSLKEDNENNRFFNPKLAGGAMLDIGSYALSFSRYFLSSQLDVVHSLAQYHAKGVDESVSSILKSKNEEIVSINISLQSKMPKVAIISGDHGYIEVPNYPRADCAKLIRKNGEIENIIEGTREDALVYEVESMHRAINLLEESTGEEMNASIVSKSIMKSNYSEDVLELMDESREKWIVL